MVLATVAGLTAANAGCVEAVTGTVSESSTDDCDRTIEIHIEETMAQTNDDLVPIRGENLPDEERALLRSAVNQGRYIECYPGSEPLQSFVDRAKDHVDRQGDDPTVYGIFEDQWYEISVYVLDEEIP